MIVRSAVTVTPTPEPTVPTPRPPEPQLRFLFTGSDGSTWDLSSQRNPVYARRGVQGLLPSNVERRWSESPVMSGSTPRGFREPMQPVTLPVWVQGAPGLGFRDIDRMFWQALAPEGECVLMVVAPDAEARTLPVLFDGPGDLELESDPLRWGRMEYPLAFTAPDPFWRGPIISRTFQPETDWPNLYDPVGYVENVIPAGTSGEESIGNPGDVHGFTEYAIGPCDTFEIGLSGKTLAGGPVNAGEVLWIDTHPARQTVGFARGENDEAAWLRLTARKFAAIPPGAEVPLVATVTNPGTPVQFTSNPNDRGYLYAALTPRYRRPW